MTATTPQTAIKAFFDIRGDEMIDDDEIAEALHEIGNPAANLHVARTAETVDDYVENGWRVDSKQDYPGVTVLVKENTYNGVGRKRVSRVYANVADCGDFRLVYVDA
jgi:hypothetical protein